MALLQSSRSLYFFLGELAVTVQVCLHFFVVHTTLPGASLLGSPSLCLLLYPVKSMAAH